MSKIKKKAVLESYQSCHWTLRTNRPIVPSGPYCALVVCHVCTSNGCSRLDELLYQTSHQGFSRSVGYSKRQSSSSASFDHAENPCTSIDPPTVVLAVQGAPCVTSWRSCWLSKRDGSHLQNKTSALPSSHGQPAARGEAAATEIWWTVLRVMVFVP